MKINVTGYDRVAWELIESETVTKLRNMCETHRNREAGSRELGGRVQASLIKIKYKYK